ncbi:MAG TPA: DNA polymerase III subunit gamma/tau, partial [Candidatus Baltobacteraceae bacterium]|nr:DNA polymerase III subunit gamma/tau [Candidatus Baltobacteraceae bacterium]
MSLYRTWRPKSFADLVGQDAVVRTLTSAIEGGKLAHAYMFSGPRGSGKTSAAKILARCINCEHGPTAHPDNTCENCVAMLNGTALDVLEIDAASNRGIDEIRALRDAVKFAPSVMRMKVYIIDEAHMLTKEGANAFLKTLEEPPAHAVFILATTEPEKLPVTILSRCQRYAFRRIAIPVMIERMREIARFEGIAIDEPALAAIAYRADGGLRDALTMLEQAAAFAEGTITTATIELAFGASGRGYANALLEAVVSRDASGVLRVVEEASDAGADMQVLIRSLIAGFRNLLVARVNPELLARDLAPEDAERATQRAVDVPQASIVRALRVLTDAASLARTGGNPRLELETALLRFVLASEDPTLEAMSARLAALEEGGVR